MKFEYLNEWKNRVFKKTEGRGRFLEFMFQPPVGKNDFVFDLHSHSTSSDGKKNSKMLGHEAQANGVKIMSITDHDTIDAVDKLVNKIADFEDYSGDFYAGVEITSRIDGNCVEVLVYDYDYDKLKELEKTNEFPFLNRGFRLKRIVDLIQKRIVISNKMKLTDNPLSLGDFVSLEMKNKDGKIDLIPFSKLNIDTSIIFDKETGDISDTITINEKKYKVNFDFFNSKLYNLIKSGTRGREFFKSYSCGAKKSIENFPDFNRFLIQNSDSPFFVNDSDYWPTVAQVAEFAKKVGGVSILAHPYGYGNLKISQKQLMKKAVNAGVDGIECMHGFNEPDEIEAIYKFCYEHDLLITAGSDTHEFYSQQGNLTEIGRFPSQGVKSKFDKNESENSKISTYNLHYFGTGAWRGEKSFDVDSLIGLQK